MSQPTVVFGSIYAELGVSAAKLEKDNHANHNHKASYPYYDMVLSYPHVNRLMRSAVPSCFYSDGKQGMILPAACM